MPQTRPNRAPVGQVGMAIGHEGRIATHNDEQLAHGLNKSVTLMLGT